MIKIVRVLMDISPFEVQESGWVTLVELPFNGPNKHLSPAGASADLHFTKAGGLWPDFLLAIAGIPTKALST